MIIQGFIYVGIAFVFKFATKTPKEFEFIEE